MEPHNSTPHTNGLAREGLAILLNQVEETNAQIRESLEQLERNLMHLRAVSNGQPEEEEADY
jgi:hypothetical protein